MISPSSQPDRKVVVNSAEELELSIEILGFAAFVFVSWLMLVRSRAWSRQVGEVKYEYY
jgi:hypothetical protein